MKEDFRKYSLILTLWTLFSLWLCWQYKASQDVQDVEENGIEVRAKIVDRHYAKGWFTNIEYHYHGKMYIRDAAISKFTPQVGDSVLIKILPDKPGELILVKERLSSILHKS